MDVKAVKTAFAGMLGNMLQLDPVTGLPYVAPSPNVGQKVRADADAPMSLADTDLPTWIIRVAGARYPNPPDQAENRLSHEDRDFELILFVCMAEFGIDGEAERKTEPYIDYSRNLIQSHPLIYDGKLADIVPWISRAFLLSDNGHAERRYTANGPFYETISFTVRVEGRNRLTYGNE